MFSRETSARCLEACHCAIRGSIEHLEQLSFSRAREELDREKVVLQEVKESLAASENDQVYNELYLFSAYVGLFQDYCSYWRLLSEGNFGKSWGALQDVQDSLRLIYKFWPKEECPAVLSYIERQCLEIEKLYPYKVFFSIGVEIQDIECSLCGKSMNSFDCEHIAGELYRGQLACGIAKNLVALNHVAVVTNPRDKRCVAMFEDSAGQFTLVRYLSGLLNQHAMRPLQFDRVQFRKIEVLADDLAAVGRNERCPCGSGKKFKKCCKDQGKVLRDHADLIGNEITVYDLMPS